MLSFFEAIISYIEIIWGFFLNFINSILSLVMVLVGAFVVPSGAAMYMWGPIGASVLSVTAFSVIKMLVGRSNV